MTGHCTIRMSLFVCVVIFFIVSLVEAEDALKFLMNARTEALNNYPRNIFIKGDLVANVTFVPFSISKLDETTQTFAFTANFAFKWSDSYLSLNTTGAEYDKSISVTYSSHEIWTPIICIMNSAFGNIFVQMDKDFPLRAHMNGRVKMNQVIGLKTKCDIDITRFPFDEQFCKVHIREYIGILNITAIGSLLQEKTNGHTEWEVLSVNSSRGKTSKDHVVLFHLRRESSFYVIGIVFPMILLSFLNSFVFLLPADSGEKISFLVSIFVTYAVFLNFVNDMIPKSDRMPRLALYLVLVQSHSTLCILATLFILNRHHKEGSKKNTEERNQKEPTTTDGQDIFSNNPSAITSSNQPMTGRCARIGSFKTLERALFLIFFILAAMLTIIFVI